jgi:hypothetical protein
MNKGLVPWDYVYTSTAIHKQLKAATASKAKWINRAADQPSLT